MCEIAKYSTPPYLVSIIHYYVKVYIHIYDSNNIRNNIYHPHIKSYFTIIIHSSYQFIIPMNKSVELTMSVLLIRSFILKT